jgi:hypothetical protein
MDNTELHQKNTSAWRVQTWVSFLFAFIGTSVGIAYLPADWWIKGFLLMGMFFTVGSAFTLSKTIRDDHESTKMINRIKNAKTERVLKDYE